MPTCHGDVYLFAQATDSNANLFWVHSEIIFHQLPGHLSLVELTDKINHRMANMFVFIRLGFSEFLKFVVDAFHQFLKALSCYVLISSVSLSLSLLVRKLCRYQDISCCTTDLKLFLFLSLFSPLFFSIDFFLIEFKFIFFPLFSTFLKNYQGLLYFIFNLTLYSFLFCLFICDECLHILLYIAHSFQHVFQHFYYITLKSFSNNFSIRKISVSTFTYSLLTISLTIFCNIFLLIHMYCETTVILLTFLNIVSFFSHLTRVGR